MFKEARIKLTAWYLAIIMTISLSFSAVIYVGVNRELVRLEDFQRARIQRIVGGIPAPFNIPPDIDAVSEARDRILLTLGLVNVSILFLAGTAGYFLAGRTLAPIAEMVRGQKEFVSNASHELRTPLTSLKTEIEVALRDKKISLSDAKRLLGSNLEDVNRMQKLSNYLLELSRYESGRDFPMNDVDLREVAEKVMETLPKTTQAKVNINLKKSIVLGNQDALVELVTILVDNGLKYGRGKGVELRTKTEGIIEVEDHGIGISKEDMPHIFDRFYRSDKSRGTEGYGLGLSIAKSIVDLHRGKIEVRSKAGRGSIFTVTI